MSGASRLQNRIFDLCRAAASSKQVFTSRLAGDCAGARVVELPRPGSYHAYFVLDLIFGRNNELFLIEANGSNAGFTSVPRGHDDPRVGHMFDTISARGLLDEPGVVLFPHSPASPAMVELYSRILNFAVRLDRSVPTEIAGSTDTVSADVFTIVVGSIPEIAPNITAADGRLRYRGAPVQFMTNPNVLAELARRGVIDASISRYGLDLSCMHEGPGAAMVERKDLQQDVVIESGCMATLQTAVAWSRDEALETLAAFANRSQAAVGKIARGSKATGVEFFAPEEDDVGRRDRLDRMVRSAQAAYGANCLSTIYPLTFVEFVASRPMLRADGDHLWDMRFECLVSPSAIWVWPGLVRVCEAPFDGKTFDRASVVSNLSTRDFRAGDVQSASDSSALLLLDVTPAEVERAARACGEWAYHATMRKADTVG